MVEIDNSIKIFKAKIANRIFSLNKIVYNK